ncbi:MAG: flagellar cap protein FliD N-terminal domain-containing protein, partial [Planctomycetaceae bacterium]
MGSIRAGVGLVSGIDTNQLINQLLTLQSGPKLRLQKRVEGLQATTAALKALEANLLTLTTAVQDLGNPMNFSTFTVTNTDEFQLAATANSDAIPGTYDFQSIRKASAFQALSKGFANADQQAVGTGQFIIQDGGHLHEPTALDLLNGGNGVRRGTIRITDRAGKSSDVNLSNAFTVDDVLAAINSDETIDVTATTLGAKIVLTDNTGASAANLSAVDLGGGRAAADLGIAQSVASDTLNGNDVFVLTGDFNFDQINDGNGIRRLAGAPDVRITLADASTIDVNLDSAFNLDNVVSAINDHADNGGKVTASLSNGRLQLTDNTTGAATFQVADINGTSVVQTLGLDVAATGNTISGRRLLAGINAVLLSNLRGGQGIDVVGQLSIADRSGTTATVDLTGAESLDEVLAAINAATSSTGTKLQLTAQVNANGTGIEIRDTSGSTAGNLIVADVGGGTLAAQLGIAINAAQDSVNGGSLNRRYRNEASSIAGSAPGGG